MGGVIHVGAWDGREYVGDQRPLLLFEPQAEAFAQLQANFAGRDNVTLVHAACGATEGTATMHTAHPNHSSSLLEPRQARDGINFAGQETVRVVTLDTAVNGRAGFTVLRIDTQGYELEVLRGAAATLATLDRVEVELHDPRVYPGAGSLEAVDDYLAGFGFVRTAFDTVHSDDLGDATYERPC